MAKIRSYFSVSATCLIAFLALLLALVIVILSLPFFNQLTEKLMNIQVGNPVFWLIIIVFTLFTGLLAGSYPALYLSSFNPVKILKGGLHLGKGAATPRKMLVVLQFTFSIALLIGTIIIYQQVQHGKNRPIGFNSKSLVYVNWSTDIQKNLEALKADLQASGMVSNVTTSNSPPENIGSNNNRIIKIYKLLKD